ncbi:energy-coupling factor ABC transporter ATP-binding protein [Treponema pedis]|uniref:energy-coupling factor ABC transporter ATP-binding protein n=1 Tax=Treponema pedis TaxID=409322 RepID=UPI000427E800|nr:ATP-binding cassette domain-containing protein [Treponema pedis]
MLKTVDLSYTYEDGTRALDNINFDSSKGRVSAIIGANGSGKSTFFAAVMGLIKPQTGKIFFNNTELKYGKKDLIDYRTKINLVFQNPDSQIFFSDIYDDLAFPLRNLGYAEEEIKRRIETAIRQTQAEEFCTKPIHFLSYGQKKRVAIAGILVLDVDVLLLDEPTSGLDPASTVQIKNIILELRKTKNIVISSHDMDLIYDIADYIYIFNKGKISAEGGKEVFLNTEVLQKANLQEPWMVKINKKLGGRYGIPNFECESEFNDYKLNGG